MITGNYNGNPNFIAIVIIISYQVITGNYNRSAIEKFNSLIISYQVITGNYNSQLVSIRRNTLYHTK